MVAEHEGHLSKIGLRKVADKVLTIGSLARGKNSQSYHKLVGVRGLFVGVVIVPVVIVEAKQSRFDKGFQGSPFFLCGAPCAPCPVNKATDAAHFK